MTRAAVSLTTCWQSSLQARLKLINLTQHLLYIQLGVIVLAQADGGLQQGKVRIAFHQRVEVGDRRGSRK